MQYLVVQQSHSASCTVHGFTWHRYTYCLYIQLECIHNARGKSPSYKIQGYQFYRFVNGLMMALYWGETSCHVKTCTIQLVGCE
jgi:hypothetical protein